MKIKINGLAITVAITWFAPRPNPMAIDKNKYANSSGSFIGVRKRTMDKAPTKPRDNAKDENEDNAYLNFKNGDVFGKDNIVNGNFDEIYNYFGDGSNLTFTGGQWVSVNTGINTLSYVGLGTTNPTDPLTVYGGAYISGVATASTFSGILSATDAVISGVGSFNNNIFVGAAVSIYGSTGFVSATKYFGDGSALLSVPSGLGTALSEDSTNPLNKMYYVDKVLSIGQTVTVDPPASSQVAFTNYPNIEINSDYDLIIADGDDFIPDILGIGTTGAGSLLGGGRVRADNYVNRSGGAPNFPEGSNSVGITTVGFATATDVWVSGAVTATSFTGDITGTASTATAAANAYGITGKPDVTLDLITADDIVVGGA